jgi:hypoxanthine phosphoribosyltransferase
MKKAAKLPMDGRVALDWDSLEADTITLAKKIVAYSKKNKLKFSKVVVIPKGGYFLGLLLPEMLGFNNDQLMHTPVQTYVPGKGDDHTGQLILGPMPTEKEIKGQDLLIVDEVWDTGMTLDFVVRYMKDRGCKSITVAVLHFKPGRSRVKGKSPDIYVGETNAWIDYAWELARKKGRQPFSVSRQTKPSRIFKLDPPPEE